MKLGHEVLNKIQDLLTNIDQPRQRTPKQKPTHNQENINQNTVYMKLYQLHKTKIAKEMTKQQEKIIRQKDEISPFKVTNKHSIFINSQSKQKPIHERLGQIKRKQDEQLQRLRQKYPHKQSADDMEEEDQWAASAMQNRRKQEKKYTKRQVQQKMREMGQREKTRLEKINFLKIKAIEDHSKEYRRKPYVGKESLNMWNRYRLKKDLSNSVFQRFQQYQVDRRANLEMVQKQIRSKVTPFAPEISENSRLIVSRSASRSDLHKQFKKSISCRCFHKGTGVMNKSTTMASSRKI